MDTEKQKAGLTGIELGEDFLDLYANNSHFEMSEWDLKVIIGQLDQHSGEARVQWHAAVTMPWLAAKLFSYYLQANLAVYEAQNGKIKIPASLMPVASERPKEAEVNQMAITVFELVEQLRRKLLEDIRTD